MYQRTMTGPPTEKVVGMRDLSKRELTVIAPVLAVLVVLGFYPKPALDMINPSVKATMVRVDKQDPQPTIAEKGTRP
jgi:NADH-quinone oxidoreductase subunit M